MPRTRRSPSSSPRVPYTAPAAATAKVRGQAVQAQLDVIERTRGAKATGRSRIDAGSGDYAHREVTERRQAVTALALMLGEEALIEVLPKHRGRILKSLRDDIDAIRWQLDPVHPDLSTQLAPLTSDSVPVALLWRTAQRRGLRATDALAAMAAHSAPYDAANNSLLPAALVDPDDPRRATVLLDALVQFRSGGRSSQLIDGTDGADDNSQGKLTASGAVAVLENRLFCQSVAQPSGPASERDYALARLATAFHPQAGVDSLFLARNLTVELCGRADYGVLMPEFAAVHQAIHNLYSAETPEVLKRYLREQVCSFGEDDTWLHAFTVGTDVLAATSLPQAQGALRRLRQSSGFEFDGALGQADLESLQQAVLGHMMQATPARELKRSRPDHQRHTLLRLRQLFDAVGLQAPTDATLITSLGAAGSAQSAVAGFIAARRNGDMAETLASGAQAREALRAAFFETDVGFARQSLWRTDRQVEHIMSRGLGVAVADAQAAARAENREGLDQLLQNLSAALRGAMAGGLHRLSGSFLESAEHPLAASLKQLQALLAKPRYSLAQARAVLRKVVRAARDEVNATAALFNDRAQALHFAGTQVDVDPEFGAVLLKETPLHYVVALAETGIGFGVDVDVGPDAMESLAGVRVLHGDRPVVFARVLVADTLDELRRLGAGPDDLCVVRELSETDQLPAVGGILFDSSHAPAGLAHIAMGAAASGIPALSSPELNSLCEFLLAAGEDGVYLDPREGQLRALPVASAIATGLMDAGDVESMRPGRSVQSEYLDVDGSTAHIHLRERSGDVVRSALYLPDLDNHFELAAAVSLDDLAQMELSARRHVAGEKAAVLSQLRGSEALAELGVKVVNGSVVPVASFANLLKSIESTAGDGTLFDVIGELWNADRDVGAWTADTVEAASHYSHSALYRDPDYRRDRLETLTATLRAGLTEHLLNGNRASAAGRSLLAGLKANDALAKQTVIARSTMTCEDRPFHSAAGQFDSVANVKGDAAMLRAYIDVVLSAWKPEAVDYLVGQGVDISKVWPPVLFNPMLKTKLSGVATSRGIKGRLGEVSYQAVAAVGGGVAAHGAGSAEEGIVDRHGTAKVAEHLKGRDRSVLSTGLQAKLRAAVLAIEQEFNRTVEPGRRFSVDVEWAVVGRTLWILQARTVAAA